MLAREFPEVERLPDAGIVSPRLLNTDLTPQSSVHALPKPVRQAFDSEVLRRALSPYDLWAPPSDFAAVMIRETLHAYMILNHGRHSARTYRLATGVSALTRLLVLAPGLVVGDEQHRLVRKAAFEQYRSILSWSCGRQKWTKRYAAPEPSAQEPSSAGG
jgi:hypothetical protein